MVLYSIYELLERCFAEGFTVESISKATDIPVELIVRCHNKGQLTPEDIHTLNYLLVFLMQLYAVNTDDNSYLNDMVLIMKSHFKIRSDTISKYLNLEENDFIIFLNKPESYNNSYSITKKIIHLFTTLIRDKRHST